MTTENQNADSIAQDLAQNTTVKDHTFVGLRTIDLDIFELDLEGNRAIQPEKVDEYTKSIAEEGLKKSIIVRHNKETGKLTVMDGNHRILACMKLQKAGKDYGWIKYEIDDTITDERRDVMQLIMNDSADLTVLDLAIIFSRLIRKGWSATHIAKTTGRNINSIKAIIKVAQAPMEIQNMISDKIVSASFVLELLDVHCDDKGNINWDTITKIIRHLHAQVEPGERVTKKVAEKHGVEVKHSRTYKKLDSVIEFAKKNEEPKVVTDLLKDVQKIAELSLSDPEKCIAKLKKIFLTEEKKD